MACVVRASHYFLHICQNRHVCRPLLRVSCIYHGFEHLASHVLLIALLVDAGFPLNVQRWAYVLGIRVCNGPCMDERRSEMVLFCYTEEE